MSTGVASEARLFLQSGYFMGEFGNIMPLALANVLSTPLLLFTSMTTMPVLLITPSVIGDAIPCLYLGFNTFGAGHYDAISIPSGKNNERPVQLSRNEVSGSILSEVTHSSQSNHKCSCGKNSNRNTPEKLFCTNSNTYSTRCPCFKSKGGCHEGCLCKQCENPHGKRNSRSLLTLSPGPSHKTTKHSLTTKGSSGKEFIERMDTNIERVWTSDEILIFEVLVQILISQEIPITSYIIKQYFNQLIKRLAEFPSDVVVKSLHDIHSLVHDKTLEAWINGYCMPDQES